MAGSVGTSLLLVFALFFSACSELSLDGTEGVGQMNFYISDASHASKTLSDDQEVAKAQVESVEEVNIDVQALRVHFISSTADTSQADTTDGDSEGEWIDIPMAPAKINLMDLSDTDSLLAEAELNEGFYSQIRLILGSENEIVVDGETHPLTVPSGQQSGYKIKLGKILHSGQDMDLTIEFDSDKSVHVTGNNTYMLKPVLQVFEGRANGDDGDDGNNE